MKIIRYFFVGAMAATIDIGVFGFLVEGLAVPWFVAGVVSFFLATTANYLISIRYVFQSGIRFPQRREMSLVFLVSAVGLVINKAALWMFIDKMAFYTISSKALASATVFLWNYGLRRKFIF